MRTSYCSTESGATHVPYDVCWQIAMRWRVEKEVVSGKGQFQCANKHCDKTDALRSWEVNFGYVEHGEKKNALVKLREFFISGFYVMAQNELCMISHVSQLVYFPGMCPKCSDKLNYHHK